MATTLHLVVPGLLGPWPNRIQTGFPQPECPALEHLLTRGEATPSTALGAEATLLQLFGLTINTDQDLPIAALTHLGDGSAPDTDWWLRADPIHLRADLRQVLLFDARCLALGSDETLALAMAFEQVFGAEGWRLETPHPQRWYLRPPQAPALRTHPLIEAIGRDITPLLPGGDDAPRWHSLLTEVQMLFHDHEVNLQREQRGDPPVNSVWFWGGGRLPRSAHSPAAGIYADAALVRGLARLANTTVTSLPDDATDWREAAADETQCLVFLETLYYAPVDQDAFAWQQGVEALERDWFAPCLALLKNRALDALIIHPCNGRVVTTTAGARHRFWRRRRPLFKHLDETGR